MCVFRRPTHWVTAWELSRLFLFRPLQSTRYALTYCARFTPGSILRTSSIVSDLRSHSMSTAELYALVDSRIYARKARLPASHALDHMVWDSSRRKCRRSTDLKRMRLNVRLVISFAFRNFLYLCRKLAISEPRSVLPSRKCLSFKRSCFARKIPQLVRQVKWPL